MAVNSIALGSNLVVKYVVGLTPSGLPIVRQKSLNDVRHDATEQDAYEVAAALFGLSQHEVNQIILKRNLELSEE